MKTTLTRRREQTGLTQAQLAGKIELSKGAYNHIERGSRRPSLHAAIALVNALALDDTAAMSLLRELAADTTATTATTPPPPAQEAA